MLLIGFLAGLVVAAAVGVGLLGMRVSTVGQADEVIDAPTATDTTQPQDTTEAQTGNEAETASGTQTAAGTQTGTQTPTSSGDVPEACVRSAEYNLAVDEAIDRLALGARDEDARTIQEALDAIQGAREDADGGAEECLDLANRSGTQ